MGHRITQKIYECSLCERTPEDGEYLWHMGQEVWCQECCDKKDNEETLKDVLDKFASEL